MGARYPRSVILVFATYLSLALWTDVQARVFARALHLSWDRPATQTQGDASVQESVDTDPEGEVERVVLPVHDKGKHHLLDLPKSHARAAVAACLTRAPPSV
jgi:hypothetical protein